MKIATLLWLCFSLIAWVAQDTSKNETPPGVTIRSFKWQNAGAGVTVDPWLKAESDSVRSDPSSSTADSGSGDRGIWFLYSVEIQNDGTKSIKAIRWDYVIVNRNSHEELGRHIFDNFENIGGHKTKSLTARSRWPPTTVLRVPKAGESDKPDVVEKVTIKCVVYDDDSVWEQPGIPANGCDSLRRGTKD